MTMHLAFSPEGCILKILIQKVYMIQAVLLAVLHVLFYSILGFSLAYCCLILDFAVLKAHFRRRGKEGLCSFNSLLKDRLEYLPYLFVI